MDNVMTLVSSGGSAGDDEAVKCDLKQIKEALDEARKHFDKWAGNGDVSRLGVAVLMFSREEPGDGTYSDTFSHWIGGMSCSYPMLLNMQLDVVKRDLMTERVNENG